MLIMLHYAPDFACLYTSIMLHSPRYAPFASLCRSLSLEMPQCLNSSNAPNLAEAHDASSILGFVRLPTIMTVISPNRCRPCSPFFLASLTYMAFINQQIPSITSRRSTYSIKRISQLCIVRAYSNARYYTDLLTAMLVSRDPFSFLH